MKDNIKYQVCVCVWRMRNSVPRAVSVHVLMIHCSRTSWPPHLDSMQVWCCSPHYALKLGHRAGGAAAWSGRDPVQWTEQAFLSEAPHLGRSPRWSQDGKREEDLAKHWAWSQLLVLLPEALWIEVIHRPAFQTKKSVTGHVTCKSFKLQGPLFPVVFHQ